MFLAPTGAKGEGMLAAAAGYYAQNGSKEFLLHSKKSRGVLGLRVGSRESKREST